MCAPGLAALCRGERWCGGLASCTLVRCVACCFALRLSCRSHMWQAHVLLQIAPQSIGVRGWDATSFSAGMRQEYWLQVLATPRPGSLVAHLDEDGDEAGAGALNPRSIYKHIVRCHTRAQWRHGPAPATPICLALESTASADALALSQARLCWRLMPMPAAAGLALHDASRRACCTRRWRPSSRPRLSPMCRCRGRRARSPCQRRRPRRRPSSPWQTSWLRTPAARHLSLCLLQVRRPCCPPAARPSRQRQTGPRQAVPGSHQQGMRPRLLRHWGGARRRLQLGALRRARRARRRTPWKGQGTGFRGSPRPRPPARRRPRRRCRRPAGACPRLFRPSTIILGLSCSRRRRPRSARGPGWPTRRPPRSPTGPPPHRCAPKLCPALQWCKKLVALLNGLTLLPATQVL